MASWDVFHSGRLEVLRGLSTADVRAALEKGEIQDDDLMRPAGSNFPWARLADVLVQAEPPLVAPDGSEEIRTTETVPPSQPMSPPPVEPPPVPSPDPAAAGSFASSVSTDLIPAGPGELFSLTKDFVSGSFPAPSQELESGDEEENNEKGSLPSLELRPLLEPLPPEVRARDKGGVPFAVSQSAEITIPKIPPEVLEGKQPWTFADFPESEDARRADSFDAFPAYVDDLDEFDPLEEDEEVAEFSLTRQAADKIEEIDMAPMVDVAFQLVLFFLVTATTILYKTLEVPKPTPEQKPAAGASQGAPDPRRTLEDLQADFIIVGIDSSGRFTIDREPIDASIETLTYRLRKARTDTGRTSMLLSADSQALHRYAVLAYDAANEIGLRIAIARPTSGPAPEPRVIQRN